MLRAVADEQPVVEKTRLEWSGPDTLAVELPVHGTETLLAAVDLPGHGRVSLPPVCLPYSPEYEPAPMRAVGAKKDGSESALRWGPASLEHLSRMTGGRERIDLGGIWTDMPRSPHMVPLAAWLLVAAVVTLLLEVLERLTGVLASGLRRLTRRRATQVAPAVEAMAEAPPAEKAAEPVVLASPTPPSQQTPVAPTATSPDLLDTLRNVKRCRR
ncbi:MAG TPA: hypothetical protein VHR72_14530 [Gemmataceae bacterium]|nr:hypothetical protein [Gemmataceae bacterium]